MPDTITEILGHDAKYWLALQARAEKEGGLRAVSLLDEIVLLSAKVKFYETRIKEMAWIMERDHA